MLWWSPRGSPRGSLWAVSLWWATGAATFVWSTTCMVPSVDAAYPWADHLKNSLQAWYAANGSGPGYTLLAELTGSTLDLDLADNRTGDLSARRRAWEEDVRLTSELRQWGRLATTREHRSCTYDPDDQEYCLFILWDYPTNASYSIWFNDTVAHTHFLNTLSARYQLGAASGQETYLCRSVDSPNLTPALPHHTRMVIKYAPAFLVLLVAVASIVSSLHGEPTDGRSHPAVNGMKAPPTRRRSWMLSPPSRPPPSPPTRTSTVVAPPSVTEVMHYLQFSFVLATLNLHYPGFYQPAVGPTAWSMLMFNDSLVAGADGYHFANVADGLYSVNGTMGMQTLGQIVGLIALNDVWLEMVVWLLLALAAGVVVVQAGLLGRDLALATRPRAPFHRFRLCLVLCTDFLLELFLVPIVALSVIQFSYRAAFESWNTLVAIVVFFLPFLLRLWCPKWLREHASPDDDDDDPQLVASLPSSLRRFLRRHADRAGTAVWTSITLLYHFAQGMLSGAMSADGQVQLPILLGAELIYLLALLLLRRRHTGTIVQAALSLARLLALSLSLAFLPTLHVPESTRCRLAFTILCLHSGILLAFALHSLIALGRGVVVLGHGYRYLTSSAANAPHAFGLKDLDTRRPSENHHHHHQQHRDDEDYSYLYNHNDLQPPSKAFDDVVASKPLAHSASATPLLPLPHALSSRPSTAPTSPPSHPSTATGRRPSFFRPPRLSHTSSPTRGRMTHSAHAADDGDEGAASSSEAESEDKHKAEGGFETIPLSPCSPSSPHALATAPGGRKDYAVRESDYFYRYPGGDGMPAAAVRSEPAGMEKKAGRRWLGLKLGTGREMGKLGRKKGKGGGGGGGGGGFEVVRPVRRPPLVFVEGGTSGGDGNGDDGEVQGAAERAARVALLDKVAGGSGG